MVHTICFEIDGIVNRSKLDSWLQSILWESTVPSTSLSSVEILRMKALIVLQGYDKPCVVQAVREMYDFNFGLSWGTQPKRNKIVFIGIII